jgi:hypothetical protein
MTPARIELSSGLAVAGPEPVSTAQATHGQNARSSGESGSGERKRKGRENEPRSPLLDVDETVAEISEFGSGRAADQDQNDDGTLHRIDSLA